MKLVRGVLIFLLLLVLLVALVQNQASLGTPLGFSFLKWSFSMVVGFWILFTFLAVAALFVLVGAWKGVWTRREIRRRDQEIARLEKELAAARLARSVPGDEPLK
jgi:uncharacterized integral membrane protein